MVEKSERSKGEENSRDTGGMGVTIRGGRGGGKGRAAIEGGESEEAGGRAAAGSRR